MRALMRSLYRYTVCKRNSQPLASTAGSVMQIPIRFACGTVLPAESCRRASVGNLSNRWRRTGRTLSEASRKPTVCESDTFSQSYWIRLSKCFHSSGYRLRLYCFGSRARRQLPG